MEVPNKSFPDEIVWRILSFSDALDVVGRARLVSKQFRNITFDSELWKVLYTNARLPRPPGPLPSQSTRFLERTLVQSALVEKTWVSEPFQEIECTEICAGPGPQVTDPRITFCDLVRGRWFITSDEFSRNIVLYDVDLDTKRILWQNKALIAGWDMCTIRDEFIYIVIYDKGGVSRRDSRFLEFKIDNDDGPLFSNSFDFPETTKQYSGPYELQTDTLSPFIYMYNFDLFFDSRTRTFYELPDLGKNMGVLKLESGTYHLRSAAFLTQTHIFTSTEVIRTPGSYLIRAFAPLPDPCLPHRPYSLRLTHECMMDVNLRTMSSIRDPIVDPQTASTRLRFLSRSYRKKETGFSCVDFTLPQPNDGDIRPILVNTQDLFSIDRAGADGVVEVSCDGHARGLCIMKRDSELSYVKFAIDATEDRCVSIVGDLSLSEAKGGYSAYPHRLPTSFDGVRGRLCYDCFKTRDKKVSAPFMVDIV